MRFTSLITAVVACFASLAGAQDIAVRAQTIHTVAGAPIENGVIVIRDGRIRAIGPEASTPIPAGIEVVECAIATPGLIDVHATVGLTGMYNVDHDQDVRESSSPLQPELRAIDAYNPREPLVAYLRSFGITTVHTGHGPGELISGQTLIAKTRPGTIDDVVMVESKAVVSTLTPQAHKSGGKSPGTRGKAYSMIRAELIKAQEYKQKMDDAEEGKEPARDIGMETLVRVLDNDAPLVVTANKMQDIASVLRLKEEFGIIVWLDMAAECHGLLDEIKQADIPVLLHPTMYRSVGEAGSLRYDAAKVLAEAGIPYAIQSGYEAYVPKVRVVLFEAGAAAGYGELGFERALRSITINAAMILGIENEVGTLEVGKHGDVAMYDGDPFEYTTHCLGTIIEGVRFDGEQEFEIEYP